MITSRGDRKRKTLSTCRYLIPSDMLMVIFESGSRAKSLLIIFQRNKQQMEINKKVSDGDRCSVENRIQLCLRVQPCVKSALIRVTEEESGAEIERVAGARQGMICRNTLKQGGDPRQARQCAMLKGQEKAVSQQQRERQGTENTERQRQSLGQGAWILFWG